MACLVLLIMVIVLAALYLKQRRAVSALAREIAWRREHQSSRTLRLAFPDRAHDELTSEIERLFQLIDQKRAELNEQSTEMHQTITNLAHDLRTPLTSAKGYLNLIAAAPGSARNDMRLKIVQQRLEVLEYLLNQLFSYAQLQEDEEGPKEEIALYGYVTAFFLSYYPQFEAKRMAVDFDIEKDLTLYADVGAFERILSNVVQNALRYGENALHVCIRRQEDGILFSFENAVSGKIDEVERLWERAVTGERHRPEGASGFGLSIIRTLVERMGGRVEMELQDKRYILRFYFS